MRRFLFAVLMSLSLMFGSMGAVDEVAAASGCSGYLNKGWVSNGYAHAQVISNCFVGGGTSTLRMSSALGQNTSRTYTQSTYNSIVISLPDRAGTTTYTVTLQFAGSGTTTLMGRFSG